MKYKTTHPKHHTYRHPNVTYKIAQSPNRIYECPNRTLGDVWAFASYVMRKNAVATVSRHSAAGDMKQKIKECMPLFDTSNKICIVDNKPNIRLGYYTIWQNSYLKTKKLWSQNSSKTVCYQFDGISWSETKNISHNDSQSIIDFLKNIGYNVIRLGSHMSIKECVDILAKSEIFVGVDSGMSHIGHSVGTPVCIVSNANIDWIAQWHHNKNFIFTQHLIHDWQTIIQKANEWKCDALLPLMVDEHDI